MEGLIDSLLNALTSAHQPLKLSCVHTFDDLIARLKVLVGDIYIIGGGMLYNSMLDYYDRVYVTKVAADGEGTVFFPNLDENEEFIIEGKAVEKFLIDSPNLSYSSLAIINF